MREKKAVAVIVILLLLAGLVHLYLSLFVNFKFNFSDSEITIAGNKITEKLTYKTNKEYHTLFRNFENDIVASPLFEKNYITVDSVNCQSGQPYSKDKKGITTIYPEKVNSDYIPYTENNEYGCTFGDKYGFKEDTIYWIQSTYELHPETLFLIDNDYYIKFIAYSKSNHKLLLKNSNLIIKGDAIASSYYFPFNYVIVYIPFEGDTSEYNIIRQNNFEFDSGIPKLLLIIFISILPASLFYLVWRFFGKESSVVDIPEELSIFPHEERNKQFWRKGWEVSAFFVPPFGKTSKNFFSALLLDFFHKKIIDIKMIKEDLFVKINETNIHLDEIEKKFLEIIKIIDNKARDKYREGKYFNLKETVSSFFTKISTQEKFRELSKIIDKKSNEYISKTSTYAPFTFYILLLMFGAAIIGNNPVSGVFLIASALITLITSASNAILTRFNKGYYREYRHWQSFKKYLNGSFAMRHDDHRAVVLWDHYLIYATALGVSKKVLKELKKMNLINDAHYNICTGISTTSVSFSSSMGSSGAGGGGGGGGGIGGGGGGGR